jgi:acyl-CoA dehydrogenase
MNDVTTRIARWASRRADTDSPLAGMAEMGLLRPLPDYLSIARAKAAIVAYTGMLGLAGVWGGRQQVGKHFLEAHGTPAQQALWLGRPLAVAISEPKVGAHPKLLTTRAETVASGYRLHGEKAWVSNGPDADAIIVIAITRQEEGRKRYSAFITPRDTPGLAMVDMPGFHALRPSRHCHMTLANCALPASALLGEPDTAYERMALTFRDVEDAVGTFSALGAFEFLIRRLGGEGEERDLALGAIIALTEVYRAAAETLVATLDRGALADGSATLVGLRVLGADITARVRDFAARYAVTDAAVATMLSDLDATQNVARGPRLARQARLATMIRPEVGIRQEAGIRPEVGIRQEAGIRPETP